MREFSKVHYAQALAAAILLWFLSGCANIPLKNGGLVVGKDTTASIEDLGVASLNSKF